MRLRPDGGERGLLALVMLGASLGFSGCSAQNPFGAVMPGSSSEPPRLESAENPSVYYTASQGMRLHTRPTAASVSTAVLPLHQKLYRSKVENGFAYVTVDGSNEKGWVENHQLIWRLPGEGNAAKLQAKDPAPKAVSAPPGTVPMAESPAPPEAVAADTQAPAKLDSKASGRIGGDASEEVDPALFDPL